MSTTQKRGFRLPWGSERQDDQPVAAVTPQAGGADDLGAGPFRRPDADEAARAAMTAEDGDDMVEYRDEDHVEGGEMIETGAARGAAVDEAAAAPDGRPSAQAASGSGTPSWPERDSRPSRLTAATRPPLRVEGGPRPARRDNPLVQGLVRAMREAAQANRQETVERLRTTAAERVEAIRAQGAADAVALGQRADSDIVAIREWSKAEVARIRQETDERIEFRRRELGRETERHESSVAELVRGVEASIAAFETDMERFFEQLLAEDDPARLATLAEQAPEPPDLEAGFDDGRDDDGDEGWTEDVSDEPGAASAADSDADGGADSGAELEDEVASATTVPADEGLAPEVAAAAEAEAEAEAIEGLHDEAPEADAADLTTNLVVRGLGSVPAISAFKTAIGAFRGVRSVSVTSGERGAFVFSVVHDAVTDMGVVIPEMPGFEAHVTASRPDGLDVSAKERAA